MIEILVITDFNNSHSELWRGVLTLIGSSIFCTTLTCNSNSNTDYPSLFSTSVKIIIDIFIQMAGTTTKSIFGKIIIDIFIQMAGTTTKSIFSAICGNSIWKFFT
ncbi:hypothetical protein RR46_00322 [Papilio xuthus]|uniref:Uncharacterized protein n=1 Tax=Papilio xuthus TaxID=66420 RepID=A0A0N1I3R3_PAPXU|nr:hypothetical protein RR46_00322 [Papilio xuthus]